MTESPEGFLICLGVPVCRTGTQKYLKSEIGEKGNELVDVYREEDEVFSKAAMASFEGKPVTDDHPPKEVDPHNYGSYIKGSVQNVRRGSGEDADHMVCDLVIYDAGLINKIKHGKREVSCGYDCKYIDNGDGTYSQADIIGNHVAIVDNGRAGKQVAIRDSKPKGGRRMAKKSIFSRMLEAFAKDAEPEEIVEAAKAVDKACGKDEEPDEVKKEPTYDESMEMVMDAIHELNEKIEAMQNENAAHHKEEAQDEEPEEEKLTGLDAVEAAIKERMSKDSNMGEEEVEVDPEEINAEDEEPEEEEESEEAEVIESDDEDIEEEEKIEAADSAMSMAMLRAIKPFIASMPPRQRRRATDALSRAVKKKATQPLPGGYGALSKRKNTADAAANDRKAFGEACRKRNPHYQPKK
jgi:hypothetical protein